MQAEKLLISDGQFVEIGGMVNLTWLAWIQAALLNDLFASCSDVISL